MPLENPAANISFNEFCLIKFYLGFQELFFKQASTLGLNNSHLYCLVFLIILLRPEDRGSAFHTGAALLHGSAPSQPPAPYHIKPPPPPAAVSSRHVCHSAPLFLCFFLVIFHHGLLCFSLIHLCISPCHCCIQTWKPSPVVLSWYGPYTYCNFYLLNKVSLGVFKNYHQK